MLSVEKVIADDGTGGAHTGGMQRPQGGLAFGFLDLEFVLIFRCEFLDYHKPIILPNIHFIVLEWLLMKGKECVFR